MKWMLWILSLSIFLLALIALSWASHRADVYSLPLTMIQGLSPGNEKPKGAACRREAFDQELEYCKDIQPGVDYTVNPLTGRIKDVAYLILGRFSVGELLVAWGPPAGVVREGDMMTLYWPGKFAFIVAYDFTPGTDVGYVEFTDQANNYQKWRGFTSR